MVRFHAMRLRKFNFMMVIVGFIFAAEGCHQPFAQGQALYDANCSRCHGMDGQGFENLYPGILESPYLMTAGSGLACVIVHGSDYLDEKRGGPGDEVPMPENKHLTPVEVLNIINYLSWEFGSRETTTIDQVMRAMEGCKE